jgi:2,4-dienoyl-CoA reductase-like NADH-dependent reductase (Old Yellow Enzyme family)
VHDSEFQAYLQRVVVFVKNSGSRYAGQLKHLGAEVVEMSLDNDVFETLVAQSSHVVLIPALESNPEWQAEMEFAVSALDKVMK